MPELLSNLNKEQKEAVTHSNGPLLIVAGAGTGKTTVITRRIANLIEQKLAKPDEILALTFTDKAAGEMQERLDLLLPLGYYDSWISTFHSFCERILKTHALDIGLPNDFELVDQTKGWLMVYNDFEKFNLDYYKPLGNPSKFIGTLLSHFSKCKDELISPQDYLEYAQNLRLQTDTPHKQGTAKKKSKIQAKGVLTAEQADETEIRRVEEVANAFFVYQKLLLDNNCLDFGDLINYTLELFIRRPAILNYYQNKFKFLMVDEFQDTNFAQYRLVKMLAEKSQNLAVVGDDDQSIYKFRGASVSNILKFKDDYPKLKQITLLENYRSGKNILDLAYKFIQQNNPDRLEIKLNIDKQLKAALKKQGTIQVLKSEDLNSELELVVKKILELKSASNTWNDFAVLIRSNSAAQNLLPALAAAQIPHTFFANTGLYEKPVILDLLAYFKFLNNVHDSFSLYRVLGMACFRLDIHDIATLLQQSQKKTLSLYQTLKDSETLIKLESAGRGRIKHLLDLAHKHYNFTQNKTVAEAAVEIIRDLDLAQKLENDTAENVENRELIEQFYKKLENFAAENQDKSTHNFLRILELEEAAGDEGKINFDPSQGPESLKVLTIHSAKGLEFENVFVINMVDKRFPTVGKKDAIEVPKELVKDLLPEGDFHLQEERRLFYVAVTRAKQNLFFSYAADYGGKQNKKPSQFLLESGLVKDTRQSKATGQVVFSKPILQSQKEIFHVLPEKFSYSQLKDFETCPLKYKYQYYLKLPVKGSQHLSFGNTLHKVFEDFLRQFKDATTFSQQDLFGQSKAAPNLPTFETLERLYEKNWIDEWYENQNEKKRFKKLGHEMLKKFYEQSKKNLPRPKYIEQSFVVFLDKYRLVGRIDRIDETDGGILIYDYKTGKAPKKSEKRDIDQLYIYQMAAQEYLKEKVVGLKYWYLRETEEQFLEEQLADNKQISGLKQELVNLIERVLETIKFDRFAQEHKKSKDHDCEFANLE